MLVGQEAGAVERKSAAGDETFDKEPEPSFDAFLSLRSARSQ
jgi:hypothetical protein